MGPRQKSLISLLALELQGFGSSNISVSLILFGSGSSAGDGRRRRLLVDDDLDDKVLLDLGFLQAALVLQHLAGEEPALVRGVDVLLRLQLLLQLADGVRHAGAETQVFAR